MLGTSDAWSLSRSSHQLSALYWRLLDFKKTPHNFWSKFVNSSHSSMRLHGLADFPEVFSNFFHIFLRLQRRDIADLRYSLGGSGWKHSRSLLNSFIVPCWKLKNQFKNNFCLWTNFQVLIESKRMAEN